MDRTRESSIQRMEGLMGLRGRDLAGQSLEKKPGDLGKAHSLGDCSLYPTGSGISFFFFSATVTFFFF